MPRRFCWLLARHYGGEFRLRIEDTDTERSKQEYTDAILASMRWLGLDWDGELTYQTQRTARYNEVIDKMLESGHAYWCSCTPEEVEAMREAARAKGEKPRYDGRCRDRHLDAAPGRVVRLRSFPSVTAPVPWWNTRMTASCRTRWSTALSALAGRTAIRSCSPCRNSLSFLTGRI